jgi:hypothetical protein
MGKSMFELSRRSMLCGVASSLLAPGQTFGAESSMAASLTFTRAKAIHAEFLCVAAIPDNFEILQPFTRLCRYAPFTPGPAKWFYDDLDFAVTSITRMEFDGRTNFGVLSAEGDTLLLRPPPFVREKIPGAGIHSQDSKLWGRMTHVRQIGGTLFACGDGGQIYRRTKATFGDERYEHMDPTLLDDPDARLEALLNNPHSEAAHMKSYFCINGPSEDDIYVCGTRGTLLHSRGGAFESLRHITQAALINILVENEKIIWICGRDGTLLTGNARDGFRHAVASGSGSQLFSSMTMHDGKIYLASSANPRGLFVYQDGRFNQVRSGLKPDIHDVHTVDSVGGVLWVVGSKDILRFDGKTWERIDHVDNTPIR